MSLVAGVDCSTQATKALVVDADSGAVVAEGRAPHEVTGSGGVRETDPETWWTALRAALAQTGQGHAIEAISIGGQQHGMVLLDEAGRPLRNAKLWNDTESAPDAAALIAARGGTQWWAESVGIVPVASFTATKWAWLRRVEPHIAEATRAIRLPHDFLNERMTNRPTTDRGDASGTAWWSTATEAYLEAVLDLDLLRIDPSLLPEVLGPTDAAGTITADAAAYLGVAAGIPVGPGTGDNAAAAVGLGLEPGNPVISLGTSGTAFMTSATRIVDPSGTVAGFADATGRFLPLAATLNCTLAVDRFADRLGRTENPIEPCEIATRLVDRGAGLGSARSQLGQQRLRLASHEIDLGPEGTERVVHAHQHDHQCRESEGAEHSGQHQREIAGAHDRSPSVRPDRFFMRSRTSCSKPMSLGSYQR